MSTDALFSVTVDELTRTGQSWVQAVGFAFAASGSASRRGFSYTSWHGSGIPPDGADPHWAESAHLTSLEPMLTYTGTASRVISIDITLIAEGASENNPNGLRDAEAVRMSALWLEALAHPFQGADGLRYSPPPVVVAWGSVFRLRGVVTGANIRWGGGMDRGDFLRADVSLSIVGAARDFASTSGADRNQGNG